MSTQHAQYVLLFLIPVINSDRFQILWSYTLLLRPLVLMLCWYSGHLIHTLVILFGNWTPFLEQLLCSADCVGQLKAEVVCSIPAKKKTKPSYYHR